MRIVPVLPAPGPELTPSPPHIAQTGVPKSPFRCGKLKAALLTLVDKCGWMMYMPRVCWGRNKPLPRVYGSRRGIRISTEDRKLHVLGARDVPETTVSNPHNSASQGLHYSHFSDEESEAQGGHQNCQATWYIGSDQSMLRAGQPLWTPGSVCSGYYTTPPLWKKTSQRCPRETAPRRR